MVQRNVECSPFPPNGDVRLPLRKINVKNRRRCPSPSKVPWVLKTEKRNYKENKTQRKLREKVQKAANRTEPDRIYKTQIC